MSEIIPVSTVLPVETTRRDVIGVDLPDSINLGRHIDERYGLDETRGGGRKIRYGGDQGVVVVGPMGKGKGTRLLVPNLLQMEGRSIVAIDPKGELAAITAPHRRKLGRVVILNPFGVLTDIPGHDDLRSDGFNPLARLDPDSEKFNADAAQLADALITVEGKEPFFSQAARNLIAALIMWVALEAKKTGTAPTMARVRELLNLPSDEARGAEPACGLPALALEMMDSGIPALRNKAAQFTSWNRTVQGIVSTAQTQTESFDDTEIATDMAKGSFDFRDIKREPITVYLILPPDYMARHAKWLRLVITAAIQSVMRARRPGEPRVLFMLDEFYALGHLEIISTVWALVRGYGVQFMPVLQNLPQLKERYPDSWETFLGMAGAIVSFAPNDLFTAEWLSRRSGTTGRENSTYSRSTSTGWSTGGGISGNGGISGGGWNQNNGQSGGSTENYSSSDVQAPVITSNKLFGIRAGSMIAYVDGLSYPVPIYAPPYYDIRQCKVRARDNPYYLR